MLLHQGKDEYNVPYQSRIDLGKLTMKLAKTKVKKAKLSL
jgi:hypothetical protein